MTRKRWADKPSRHARGYGASWDRIRLHALKRDSYLCQPCLKRGHVTEANEVDHITPKAQGGTDDLGNLQAICRDCHRDKTASDEGWKRPRQVGLDGYPV
ncbi:HNH endonuclease signature motif containing protein [Paracoccus sp. DMF-8]|uniref:HNH endonuclease n=1 Tax=Paracoccus sp. DMF-8 TaxID=3019445 RepID=UPI0023E8A41F|nr:HNH endonuclease signature motif containing protein [Paracoccus sp. DMF-8]MDF3606318.1 HNH endonuclease signature motif containing protein [Paracoccus sp. DMF-8]